MNTDLEQMIQNVLDENAPEYFIVPKGRYEGRYEIGCLNCPWALRTKPCYDAFSEIAKKCNLYDHRKV